jgi:hypothetical protein
LVLKKMFGSSMPSMSSRRRRLDLRSLAILMHLPHLPGNGSGRKKLKKGKYNAILSFLSRVLLEKSSLEKFVLVWPHPGFQSNRGKNDHSLNLAKHKSTLNGGMYSILGASIQTRL